MSGSLFGFRESADDGGAGGCGVRFALLGPVRAWRAREQLLLGTPQQHAVLAALLLRRGRVATVEELIDAVWGEQPPARAVQVLRTYVSRLRKCLEPSPCADDSQDGGRPEQTDGQLLRSMAGGYLLDVPVEAVDLGVFEARVAEAERLRRSGRPAVAAKLLRTALDDWEGTPLAGVPGPLAEKERGRLDELRLEVTECRVEIDLALGEHHTLVGELTSLSADFPLRERITGQLMRALYGASRQAEALAVYRDTRRTLVDELGVEPCQALRDLHARVLSGDPALGSAAAPRPPGAEPGADATGAESQPHSGAGRPYPDGMVVPAQLPHSIRDFKGRQAEFEELRDALLQRDEQGPAIGVVTGMGGVGKTALCVRAAHAVSASMPDGQLYADLRGSDGTRADPHDILGDFIRALGGGGEFIPDDLAERAALFRSKLAGRHCLVLLDNAHCSEQVSWLLPGSGTCAVLVNSRSPLASLPAARRIHLQVMQPGDALEMFGGIVGNDRVASDRPASLRVIEACGGLPLALRIVASRLAARPSWTVADLAERLGDEQGRLRELRTEDLAVEAAFWVGYQQLDEEQARVLRLLSLPAPVDASLGPVASVLDKPLPETEAILESLVDIGMLESPTHGRYRFHDLLRLFAQERSREQDSEAARCMVFTRLLQTLLATAVGAYRVLRPGHTLPDLFDEYPPPEWANFPTQKAAWEWGRRLARPALGVARQSAATSPGLAADLLLALDPVLEEAHYWNETVPVAEAVVRAAESAGHRRAEARARYILGGALMEVARFDEGERHTLRSIALADTVGDHVVRGMALNVLGVLHAYGDRQDVASDALNDAIGVARDIGDRSLEALALGNRCVVETSAPSSAATSLATAHAMLDLVTELGDPYTHAVACLRMGQALTAVDRLGDARQWYERGQRVLSGCEKNHGQLDIRFLHGLAGIHQGLGQLERAVDHAERAMAESQSLNFPQFEAECMLRLGLVLRDMGRGERALTCLHRAARLYDRLGMRDSRLDALVTDSER